MPRSAALAAATLAAVLAWPAAAFAPPATWPQFRHDAGHSGWNRAEQRLTGANVGRLRQAWRVDLGRELYSSPAVVGGVVYVGSDDGVLHALAASTGRELWRADLGSNNWSSSPAVVGGRVYVLAGDSVVHAFDATTGKPVWATAVSGLEGGWLGSPTVAWGRVFVIREGVTALDAADGHLLWNRFDLDCFGCTASLTDGRVFVSGWNADDPSAARGFFALDAATGETLWSALPEKQLDVSSGSSPIYARSTVYVRAFTESKGIKRHRIYALNQVTGEVRWTADVGTSKYFAFGLPAVARGIVYYPSTDGRLYALGALAGKQRWTAEIGLTNDSPAVAGGAVYVGNDKGVLSAFEARHGKLLWRTTVSGELSSAPTVADGTLFVGTIEGVLYAFRPRGR